MEKLKRKRIITITGWIIFCPVVAYLIFFIIVQLAFPFKAVNIMGFQTYLVANTGSMEPELSRNDFIITKKYDFDRLKVGDAITFQSKVRIGAKTQTVPITHKIVEIITDEETGQISCRTQGLNVAQPDQRLVTADGADGTNRYLGKYAGKSTLFGNTLVFFRSPFGVGAVVISTGCVVGITLLAKSIKKDTSK